MKKVSKLQLNTETLRRLTGADMAGIAGGRAASYYTHPCSNMSLIMAPMACVLPATNVDCNTYDGCDHKTDDAYCTPINPT